MTKSRSDRRAPWVGTVRVVVLAIAACTAWSFIARQEVPLSVLTDAATWIGLAPAQAETIDGQRIVIVDGDTVALPCATPAPGCSERIRLTAIDAPESWRPHCEAEGAAGLKAKARLAEILRAGPVTITRSGRKDRYGRTLADLATPAGDAGAILQREGLALPYAPGREAHAQRITHWCGAGDW